LESSTTATATACAYKTGKDDEKYRPTSFQMVVVVDFDYHNGGLHVVTDALY
jgi:hypothetical protein